MTAVADVLAAPVTEQLKSLLAELCRGGRGDVRIVSGRDEFMFDAAYLATRPPLPYHLMRELGYVPAPEIVARLATSDRTTGELLDVTGFWVDLPFTRAWSQSQSYHPEGRDQVLQPLRDFPEPPTFVVDRTWGVVAVWLLRAPVAVNDGAQLRRVEQLQRTLAERLGGRPGEITEVAPGQGASFDMSKGKRTWALPAWHPVRAVLPLPASRTHEYSMPGDPVVLVAADFSRRIQIEDLERAAVAIPATAGAPTGSTSSPRKTAARTTSR